MNHSVDPAVHRIPWHGRAFLTGLLLVVLLALSAFAPASMFAPLRERAQPGVSSMLAPGSPLIRTSPASGARRMSLSPADTSEAIVTTSDPEPGIGLITAVYNSIQDRFFKPL